MEKQFSREERLMHRIIKEAGTKKPSAHFKNNIMQAIQKREEVKAYKPLISPAAWGIVASFLIISSIALVWMYGNTGINFSEIFGFKGSFKFPELHLFAVQLSKTMQYAIAFIALFFLQIPFLKRFVETR